MLKFIAACCLVLASCDAAEQAEPEVPRDPTPLEVAPRPHERPAHQPEGNKPRGRFSTADELLTALEESDRELHTLTAAVIYDQSDVEAGDHQVRTGKLFFRSDPQAGRPPLRRFAAEFDKLFLGNRLEEEVRQYIFDGTWMAEKIPAEKICNRQQVVPPGEQFDPLRLGEGPLPIPIGQKKEDILARFEVELVPPESGLRPANFDELSDSERSDVEKLITFATVPGTYQLKLTPREGQEDRTDVEEVRLWYRAKDGRLLPHMARAVKRVEGGEGDVSIMQLANVKTNTEVDPRVFSTEPPMGWDGRDEPWREAAGGDGR